MPKVGLIELRDNETGRRVVVDTASAAWRKRYAELVATELAHREQTFRRSRIDCIKVSTGQPYVDELVKFFRQREVRR